VAVRHVETPVTGRFLVRAALSGRAPLLVGFHGYGETADDHLAALERIPGAAEWHLVAIQALHPFYKRSGEVVAGWMTRLDREQAIDANLTYVRRALDAVRAELTVEGPLVLAGFSQGTAMAWRAAALAVEGCAAVIALAGDLPSDLAERSWVSRPRVLIGRGAADTWYTAEREGADLDLLAGLGLDSESFVFDGGHEWSAAFLERCAAFLAEVTGPAQPAFLTEG
jgi:predicted esterase